ncbi:hypothetical protein EYZ11_010112 [Aspergillus tanneri]|uniref:Uncharacterized protein n=1 Tax=Aspergillus tanneri TaxID=1220188 RepID=A0A4S3J6H4_9EURO|nr:hypothetical protein EYZ11_010112 [Aspergillus tanneri]
MVSCSIVAVQVIAFPTSYHPNINRPKFGRYCNRQRQQTSQHGYSVLEAQKMFQGRVTVDVLRRRNWRIWGNDPPVEEDIFGIKDHFLLGGPVPFSQDFMVDQATGAQDCWAATATVTASGNRFQSGAFMANNYPCC